MKLAEKKELAIRLHTFDALLNNLALLEKIMNLLDSEGVQNISVHIGGISYSLCIPATTPYKNIVYIHKLSDHEVGYLKEMLSERRERLDSEIEKYAKLLPKGGAK